MAKILPIGAGLTNSLRQDRSMTTLIRPLAADGGVLVDSRDWQRALK